MQILTKLSLRFRIFLFFAFMAVAAVLLVIGALLVGAGRATPDNVASGFVFAGVLSSFGLLRWWPVCGSFLTRTSLAPSSVWPLACDPRPTQVLAK